MNNDAFARREMIPGVGERDVGPIWMDKSTREQVRTLVDAAGGLQGLIELTGSGGFERFTGPQIAKFFDLHEESYRATQQLPLVSTFHNGLLGGGFYITPGDAAGTSLMNIRTRQWDPRMLNAAAPNLEERLPTIIAPDIPCGRTSQYARERYALDALCFAWEGDNPSSLIGVGGVKPGKVAISLGTSDTFFGNTGGQLIVDLEGELSTFGAPTDLHDNMYLGCWLNGSTAREKEAERFHMDWNNVSGYLLKTEPDPDKMGVYWFDAEITPNAPGNTVRRTDGFKEDDVYNVRAIVEAKIMSMMIRLEKIGIAPTEIYVTAGASENDGILQTIADVSGAKVYRQEVKDSGPLGGALRAKYGYLKHTMGKDAPGWGEVVAPFVSVAKTFTPSDARHAVYEQMIPLYKEFEKMCAREAK